MDTPLQEQWAKKSRFLTQALIFSGALNIGLLTSFVYFVLHEKKESVAFELQPVSQPESKKMLQQLSNAETVAHYATMSYAELVDLLSNQEAVEEGYKKRDLALASLAAFHFINLDKALHGFPVQKRLLSFQRKEGPERVDITVYPGLTEDQYQAVLQFIKTEKFPFTAQGLFFEIQQSKMPRDPSLLEAFFLTPEFTALSTLLNRAGVPLPAEYVVDLIAQGDWLLLQQFTQEQKLAQDLSPLRLKNLLCNYIRGRSVLAAKILLEWDREFILKKFEDPDLMAFLDLFPHKTGSLELLLKELITSPRSDAIWKKAAEKLYVFAGATCPDPYDHLATLQTFAPNFVPKTVKIEQLAVAKTTSAIEPSKPAVAVKTKRTHVIQNGDNLWKIARKYKVSIEALRKANHLDSDKLRPGKELLIPASS
ncbi:MAG: LysM peptidoglycan-binding domain-containing protein [Verrucomicrobia bacterium]|nr:LysM peptidoglycan-binding domain-containing protein [Verrucomicrobiota bacterium]